jgi:hypothetical protein
VTEQPDSTSTARPIEMAPGLRGRLLPRPQNYPAVAAWVVPQAVERYLLPGDELRFTIRQHPVLFAPPVATAAGVLLGTAADSMTGGINPALMLILWLITTFLAAWACWVIVRWLGQYVVVTTKNVTLIAGATTRTVTILPMSDLAGMTLERSAGGRLMGYGALRFGGDSSGQLLISFVPYPEQLYLEIRRLARAADEQHEEG